MSGPITIAKVAGDKALNGMADLYLIYGLDECQSGYSQFASNSMLDGGHLVYYFIEAIRGKPVSEQIQIFGLKVGMVLLGSMMLLALFNDFMRL